VHVRDILHRKGSTVVTVPPGSTVDELLRTLAEQNIGAVIVSSDGQTVDGVVSERDVVRGLADEGATLLAKPVSAIMTTDLRTASPDDTVDDVMAEMTEHRVRHIPVLVEGHLVGIVSIGDAVKIRMDELESDRAQLIGYISSGS
jgi:CBS domain-containing protein